MKVKGFSRVVAFLLMGTLCFGANVFAAESDINVINYRKIKESNISEKGTKISVTYPKLYQQENEKYKKELNISNLSEEQLDAITLKEDREKRKQELNGITFSWDEERYAAFFGAKYDAVLDTRPDVYTGDIWFRKMKYITEPFTQPVFSDLDRRFYCTDIVTISGHGTPDEVAIGCVEEDRTNDNCIGVRASPRNSTSGDFEYIGIGKKDLSYCRLMMFIACRTTDAINNIASYAVDNGAQASMGWYSQIDGRYSVNWLVKFYSYLSSGYTINDAKNRANADVLDEAITIQDNEMRLGMLSLVYNNAYGNTNRTLTYNPGRVEKKSPYTSIDESINIDYENKNFEELISYLEKNVAGFDRENCELAYLHTNFPHEDSSSLFFERKYNGFATNYNIYIVTEGDKVMYISSLDQFKEPKETIMISNDISDEIIEKAKIEAVKKVGSTDKVYEQTVVKRLGKDFKPYLHVETVFIDEVGAFYAFNFAYELEKSVKV